jgi:alpha-N-arabinofuranosidase
VFLKLVNASSNPQPVAIRLDGTGTVSETATLISLAAAVPASTNTITDPTRVIPMTSTISAATSFKHTMPAYSIQVLEISVK